MDFSDLVVLGGVPIDLKAVGVVLPGYEYCPDKKIDQLMFDVRPPMPDFAIGARGAPLEDLTGRAVGRMTVIGYWGRKKRGGKAGKEQQLWVCRCPCGMYVTRNGKTIVCGRDPDDKCEICRHVAHLKKVDRHRQTGKWDDER